MTQDLEQEKQSEVSTDETVFVFDVQVLGMMAVVFGQTQFAAVRGLFGETQNRMLRHGPSDGVSITQGRNPQNPSQLGVLITIKRGYFGESKGDERYWAPMESLKEVEVVIPGMVRVD